MGTPRPDLAEDTKPLNGPDEEDSLELWLRRTACPFLPTQVTPLTCPLTATGREPGSLY